MPAHGSDLARPAPSEPREPGVRSRSGLLLVLVLAAGGCASRPLTRPQQLASLEKLAVAGAVGSAAALLVVHAARWMLGRWPGRGDGDALFLAGGIWLALVASALVVLCHHRADDLLDTPIGDGPRTIIGLQAHCGVTSGDGFLEFHVDHDSCSIDRSGAGLAAPLAVVGLGLLGLGRWRPRSGWTRAASLASGVPIGVAGYVGLHAVSPGTATLVLWAGALLTVFSLCSTLFAWADARTAGQRPERDTLVTP